MTSYYLVTFLCLLACFLPIFSRTGYYLKAKILKQGEKILFVGTSLYKFRSSTPPPPDPLEGLNFKSNDKSSLSLSQQQHMHAYSTCYGRINQSPLQPFWMVLEISVRQSS